uniref:TTF-type domain-containing protein n=1 Tax=Acanthochromis polyacanthus TaxID=80966 RepID=A0A3Q1H4Y5_9TELE
IWSTFSDSPLSPKFKVSQGRLVFPRTMQGNKKRSFNSDWYKQHPWLEYSQSQDSAYCFPCRHFSLPNTPASVFTPQLGFSHWKKAMYKDGGFKVHEKSEGHVNAMFAWGEHKKAILTDSSKRDALNEAYNKKVQENRKYIKTVAEVLLLTATQNIAQRGHRETEEVDNRGNFLEILEMIAKHDPVVQKKMKGKQNAKYTSSVIQNEILECLANTVREEIIQEVKESEVFPVIADETKDLKKKQQLSLVLRYYYNGAVHESFLDFQQATRLDAEGRKDKIIHCLEKYGLEYRTNLVGQGYDGASVMSGKHSGVAARIKTGAKHAFYGHCNAHCLNLVLTDTVKAVPEADCFFCTTAEALCVYVWVLCSPEVARYTATENSGERSVDAQGLLNQLDLSFVSLLATFRRLLGDAKVLSDSLQSPSLDLAMAVDLVSALKDSFQEYRSETFVDSLWKDIGDTRKCNDSDKDSFRRTIFYPIVDTILGELDRHFSKDNCDIMRGRQALDPKSKCFLQEQAVFRLGEIYESDSEDLSHELHQTRRLLQRKQQSGMQKLSSIVELAVFLEPHKDVFHELFRLCKIAIALPVSRAACERSFSALKLIKSHLRTTMTDDRLSNLGVLSIEARRAKSLDMDKFIKIFADNHQNRRIHVI